MLDKQSIKIIHLDIIEALNKIAEKHNLSKGSSNIKFDESSFKITCEFGDKSTVKEGYNPILVNNLKRNGFKYKLDENDIGKEIKINSDIFIIIGMKGFSKIICSSNKKNYVINGSEVQRALGRL